MQQAITLTEVIIGTEQVQLSSESLFTPSTWKLRHACDNVSLNAFEKSNSSKPVFRTRLPRIAIVFSLFSFGMPLFAEKTRIEYDDTKDSLKQNASAKRNFVYPGVAHARESIEFVKSEQKSNQEPWLQSWELLKKSPFASPDWNPQPRARIERGSYNHPTLASRTSFAMVPQRIPNRFIGPCPVKSNTRKNRPRLLMLGQTSSKR